MDNSRWAHGTRVKVSTTYTPTYRERMTGMGEYLAGDQFTTLQHLSGGFYVAVRRRGGQRKIFPLGEAQLLRPEEEDQAPAPHPSDSPGAASSNNYRGTLMIANDSHK